MIPCAVETCNTAKLNNTPFLFKTIPKFSTMLLSNKFICLTLDSSINNKSSKENKNWALYYIPLEIYLEFA